MKTEQHVMHKTMHLHAIPKTSYELENLQDGELPYTYKLWEFDSYGNNETAYVGKVEVSFIVPGGVDLRMGVIESLENKLKEKEKEFQRVKKEIEDRIRELRLIGYDPRGD